MFPPSTRTFFTATLATGTTPEPDLTNQQFLASFLDYSCWLRPLAAKQSLSIVQQTSAGKLDKLAALAAFYQTAGLAVEDALTMYIAWSLWSHNKSQSIPTILERLFLRLNEPSHVLAATYATDVAHRMLNSDKRVDVYARAYLTQVMNVSDKKLPNAFGIAWKLNPSVKLVRRDMLPSWNKLGEHMEGEYTSLSGPKRFAVGRLLQ